MRLPNRCSEAIAGLGGKHKSHFSRTVIQYHAKKVDPVQSFLFTCYFFVLFSGHDIPNQ